MGRSYQAFHLFELVQMIGLNALPRYLCLRVYLTSADCLCIIPIVAMNAQGTRSTRSSQKTAPRSLRLSRRTFSTMLNLEQTRQLTAATKWNLQPRFARPPPHVHIPYFNLSLSPLLSPVLSLIIILTPIFNIMRIDILVRFPAPVLTFLIDRVHLFDHWHTRCCHSYLPSAWTGRVRRSRTTD